MQTVGTADTVSGDHSMGRKHADIRRAGSWVALFPVLLVLAALLTGGDSQLTGGDVAHAQSADPPAKPTGADRIVCLPRQRDPHLGRPGRRQHYRLPGAPPLPRRGRVW